MVGVSASVNLPLHHKVQKFSSGTGSPGWSRKRAVKWLWCGVVLILPSHRTDSVLEQTSLHLFGKLLDF